MTEVEKMDSGQYYSTWDKDVNARKHRGVKLCEKLQKLDQTDEGSIAEVLKELFLKAGSDPWVGLGFYCDYGLNIEVGDNFVANFNVVILDGAKVTIGDNVMIGPNSMISTINHPITPKGRREHLAISQPVTIGNDVWIGGNVTILPGVTIGNNVVVGAGSVVTKDVPDNCVVAGVPAKVIRSIENDVE